ncbi:beta-1-4-N-acetylgalactosaminyltransferase bre-4-like [Brachionus plicatilis]|uniref:Beta-1,4-galactosyltransferase n=1 Tax=Brachionus plicatilis TaxID=10195 RepID=A0A3M7QA94_BRAPC|nr:beta-1-4-N-acetylgalactosaminyltransferase bre-4-like [Brachionus plicatilis]
MQHNELQHKKNKEYFILFQKLIVLCLIFLVLNFLFTKLKIKNEPEVATYLPRCQYFIEIKNTHKNKINQLDLSYKEIENNFKNQSIILHEGRSFTNINNHCDTNENKFKKIAFIIPYRDREKNLRRFLFNMHPLLIKQNINYGIYLIEPDKDIKFNRGLILNAGFMEVIKTSVNDRKLNSQGGSDFYWDCFIFHDVDMIPENNLLYYTCDEKNPLHLAVTLRQNNYSFKRYWKDKYFGGINAFSYEQFTAFNGFSNLFFDWGCEDDDLRERVRLTYGMIVKLQPDIGRFYTDKHEIAFKNQNRGKLRMGRALEGLSTLKYSRVAVEKRMLFTRIKIGYNFSHYSKQILSTEQSDSSEDSEVIVCSFGSKPELFKKSHKKNRKNGQLVLSNDICVVDRGFRDSIKPLENKGKMKIISHRESQAKNI